MSYNHIMASLYPYYYPSSYPYHNLQYQGSSYHPMMMPENLNETPYPSSAIPTRPPHQRIYNLQTNQRDAPYKNQRKPQPEIINL